MFSDRRKHALHNDINPSAKKLYLCITTSIPRRTKNLSLRNDIEPPTSKELCLGSTTSILRRKKSPHSNRTVNRQTFPCQTANVKFKAETMSDPDRIFRPINAETRGNYQPLTKTAHTVKSKRYHIIFHLSCAPCISSFTAPVLLLFQRCGAVLLYRRHKKPIFFAYTYLSSAITPIQATHIAKIIQKNKTQQKNVN